MKSESDTSLLWIYKNIFRLTCVKLRIELENFKGVFARLWFKEKTSNRLCYASAEFDRTYSLTLPRWKSCVTSGHVTSRNESLYSNEQGRLRRQSLGRRLFLIPIFCQIVFLITTSQIACLQSSRKTNI